MKETAKASTLSSFGGLILHLATKSPRTIVLGCVLALAMYAAAGAQASAGDPSVVCERAALQAERDWRLPQGLLVAIGLVESGRRMHVGTYLAIWPWTINAQGQEYYQPSKAAAVSMVRDLHRRSVTVIDVGCFQVDLFDHPYAFASVEEAFEPDANARAAARILSLGRLNSTGWDGAVAAYHSATPLFGAQYLERVHAVWPWMRAHLTLTEPGAGPVQAVLLSPQARLVRVVTPFDSCSSRAGNGTPMCGAVVASASD